MHILLRAPTKCRIFTSNIQSQVCAGITLASNKSCGQKANSQKRCSSYYTNPLITGVQQAIENVHEFSMMPWCGTIIGGTLVLRAVLTLPLAVKQNQTIAQMELLQPQLEVILKSVKADVATKARENGKTEKEIKILMTKEIKSYTNAFYKSKGISRVGLMLLPWVQMPLWILISLAMRNISGVGDGRVSSAADSPTPTAGIETEGFFWLTDLSVTDPYYVIPVLLFLTNFLNLRLNALQSRKRSRFSVIVTRTCEVLTISITYISTLLPAAMTLYWVTSSTYGLAQNIAMKYPKVKRLLGVPKTPSEVEKPLTHYKELFRGNMEKWMKSQRQDRGK